MNLFNYFKSVKSPISLRWVTSILLVSEQFLKGLIGLITIFQREIKRIYMILTECNDCFFAIIPAGYILLSNRYLVPSHEVNDVVILWPIVTMREFWKRVKWKSKEGKYAERGVDENRKCKRNNVKQTENARIVLPYYTFFIE